MKQGITRAALIQRQKRILTSQRTIMIFLRNAGMLVFIPSPLRLKSISPLFKLTNSLLFCQVHFCCRTSSSYFCAGCHCSSWNYQLDSTSNLDQLAAGKLFVHYFKVIYYFVIHSAFGPLWNFNSEYQFLCVFIPLWCRAGTIKNILGQKIKSTDNTQLL